MEDDSSLPFGPLHAELERMRRWNLNQAIQDVDDIMKLLSNAREKIIAESNSGIPMTMISLQNGVKVAFDGINNDLKEVTKAQRGFGKALDKALPLRNLPVGSDAMADHPALINRAISMHLLREGQFSVASTFLHEGLDHLPPIDDMTKPTSHTDEDGDDDMQGDDAEGTETEALSSGGLQDRFSEMYKILSELKARNLLPAIKWAHEHSLQLEAKGSNLEFELSKLQYVWLFKGPAVNGLPDDSNNGLAGALQYARRDLARFQARNLREVEQLCCAMIYASNLEQSPYRHVFEIKTAFEDVAMSFTREFCSLLGLSAESPLYLAVTAGAIALPRLIKYAAYTKNKKTEWTSENELAFETPLPPSMIYHPIFVCPVSKEQVTETNPAMMLPCGHVICNDSLRNIAKGQRYKCPYCPLEGHMKDATRINL